MPQVRRVPWGGLGFALTKVERGNGIIAVVEGSPPMTIIKGCGKAKGRAITHGEMFEFLLEHTQALGDIYKFH